MSSEAKLEELTTDIFQKYGEESRAYRRTVYTHDDWVRHRSSDRFFRNLGSFATSGIYKSLFKEVIATATIASFVVVWNMIFGDYQDLQNITHNGIMHDSLIPVLALPLAPFTLSSPSLGLLLGKSTLLGNRNGNLTSLCYTWLLLSLMKSDLKNEASNMKHKFLTLHVHVFLILDSISDFSSTQFSVPTLLTKDGTKRVRTGE